MKSDEKTLKVLLEEILAGRGRAAFITNTQELSGLTGRKNSHLVQGAREFMWPRPYMAPHFLMRTVNSEDTRRPNNVVYMTAYGFQSLAYTWKGELGKMVQEVGEACKKGSSQLVFLEPKTYAGTPSDPAPTKPKLGPIHPVTNSMRVADTLGIPHDLVMMAIHGVGDKCKDLFVENFVPRWIRLVGQCVLVAYDITHMGVTLILAWRGGYDVDKVNALLTQDEVFEVCPTPLVLGTATLQDLERFAQLGNRLVI